MEAEQVAVDISRPLKKQRLFIARQACEHCRQKKTRCDESNPCGPCRSGGIECSYGERKASKNEVSLSMILHKLERIDGKIDQLGFANDFPSAEPLIVQQPELEARREPTKPTTPISFSAHLMIDWPAVRQLLPSSLVVPSGNYSLQAEEQRSPLPVSNPRSYPEGFLSELSISTVKELSDAYFATFNLMSPVLDRKIYLQQTLSSAISGGWGYDTDSCIVLVTMALGCWGMQAISEAEQLQNPQVDHHTDTTLGLAFYNEARKRIGFLECDNGMAMCQVYLLSAIYYGQLLRPVDCWSMLTRSSTCCLRFWGCSPEGDEWTLDMYSRLFWITVMIETVLTQELTDLPTSKIRDMEEQVQLPKFVQPYPGASEEDESFYHYHFLSQIAHRMFLTRVYSSSYYSSPNGDYPNPNLTRELYHQLEQWRSQLPPALRFGDETPDPEPELSNIIVVSWLRARYSVARYHIGRPYLYKALHHPDSLTDHDRQRCSETLRSVLRWSEIIRNISSVKGCNHIAFFVCGQ